MSFPTYPTYKDSFEAWVGDVPIDWQITPLKRSFRIEGGSTPSPDENHWDGDIVWLTPADLSGLDSLSVSVSKRTIAASGLASCGASLLPSGSLVLSTRAPIGSLAIAAVEVCTNQGCKGLVPVGDISSKYYAYVLGVAKEELNNRGKGTTFLEISGDELGRFAIPVPPILEQWQIARFLDHEAARIDALIAEQRRLIELLKGKRQAVISHAVTKGLNPDAPMKDSGVEWLGQVPAHWAVCKLNFRYEVELGKMLDEKRNVGASPLPYLRNQDVQWGSVNIENLPLMDIHSSEIERYTVRSGDLLVCEGGDVGRAAIWSRSDLTIGYQKALHRLRVHSLQSDVAEFFFYVLMAAKSLGVFEESDTKATISHLPAEKFRQYRFSFPPLSEQIEIAEFLSVEYARMLSASAEVEKAIGLLQERRSALISAAVTGKIDVRGWQPPAESAASITHNIQ